MSLNDLLTRFSCGSRPSWAGPFFNDDDGGGGGAGGTDGDGTAGGGDPENAPPGGASGAGDGGKDDAAGGAGKDGGAEGAAEGGDGDDGQGGQDGQESLTPESFTLPEGYAFRDEDAKSFIDIFSDKALSEKEKAQKALELHCKVLGDYTAGLDASDKEAAAAEAKAAAEQEAAWLDACKADADVGGHNWEKSQARYERAVRELKLDGLHGLMSEMGMQNHPDYFKAVVGLHDLIAEDSSSGGKSSGEKTRRTDLDRAHAIFKKGDE